MCDIKSPLKESVADEVWPGQLKGFDVGDVVMLKSGGHPMTVSRAYINRVYDCVWHDNKGECQEKSFHGDLLILASDNERFRLNQEIKTIQLNINKEQVTKAKQEMILSGNGRTKPFPKVT